MPCDHCGHVGPTYQIILPPRAHVPDPWSLCPFCLLWWTALLGDRIGTADLSLPSPHLGTQWQAAFGAESLVPEGGSP
jgi:hypothetical protein